jgi:hypothetical protein
MNDDNRTLYQLTRDVMACQNASNLSGVVHSFGRDISRLRVLLEEKMGDQFDTCALNQHPIVVCYVSKLVSLSRHDEKVSEAFRWCFQVLESDGQEIPVLPE